MPQNYLYYKTQSGLTLTTVLESLARDVKVIKATAKDLFNIAKTDYFMNENAPWENYQTFLSKLHEQHLIFLLNEVKVIFWKGNDEQFRLIYTPHADQLGDSKHGAICAYCHMQDDLSELVSVDALRRPLSGHYGKLIHPYCEQNLREKPKAKVA